MSKRGIFIPIVASFACIAMASGPTAPPASPSLSGAGAPAHLSSTESTVRLLLMPIGNRQNKRPVSGKVTLGAFVPPKTEVDTIVYYLDDQEVGRTQKLPYRLEWDSKSVNEGEHTVKWRAVNSSGNEVVAGSQIVIVSNSGKIDTPKHNASADVRRPARVTPANSVAVTQFATFTSPKYKFRIDYPATWVVKDQSSSLDPTWQAGYWLLFSMGPIDKSNYVVNVRHKLLKQSHNADSFAKFTPYIASWERQEFNGYPVFLTTAGTPEAKRVVHRAMVINGKDLWMMNLIDKSGKPAAESKDIFMRMVTSLTGAAAPPPVGINDPVIPPVQPDNGVGLQNDEKTTPNPEDQPPSAPDTNGNGSF